MAARKLGLVGLAGFGTMEMGERALWGQTQQKQRQGSRGVREHQLVWASEQSA